jgi:TolC family type I secretion outer membrane protein
MSRAIRSVTAAAVCVALFSAPAAAEDLTSVLAEVYRSNPTIEAARSELRSQDEAVPQAQSNWRPTVRVQGSVTQSYQQEQTRVGEQSTTRTPGTASIEARQPIYEGGSNWAELSRAKNAVRAARARLETTTQDVLLRAVRAYVAVWRDQRILELNEQNVQALRTQLEATRSRFEEGFVTDTDVSQAQTRLSQARARLQQARTQLQDSFAQFQEVVGRRPGELAAVSVPDSLPAERAAAQAAAREGAPRAEAARFRSRAARDSIRRAEGRLLPSLSLSARASTTTGLGDDETTSAGTNDAIERESASVSLELSIPLYQAGQATSQVRQAKSAANQRRLQVREAVREVEREAETAWNAFTGTRAQVDELRQAVSNAERALEGVEAEHRAGTRTVLDILDAERELTNARVELANAKAEAELAAYRLLRAIGGLSPDRLGLDVDVYDPLRHYGEVDGLWWGLTPPGGAE